MEDVNSLDFSTFLLNNFSNEESTPGDLALLIQRYYELKMENSKFLINPKKRLRTIPDFSAMLKSDYDRVSNPGKELTTNLPMVFIESAEKLQIDIKDANCDKSIVEIIIKIGTKKTSDERITNVHKELFLYDIASIKSKQSTTETSDSSRNTEVLDELAGTWTSLKAEIDTFTTKYETFIQDNRLLKTMLSNYHNNVIHNINTQSLSDFENNITVSNLTNTGAVGDDTARIIKFYMIINILLTKYNKIQALLSGNKLELNMVRSVVFKRADPITINNIFIVNRRVSSTKLSIIDMKGVETDVPADLYAQVYEQQKISPNEFGEFTRKHRLADIEVSVKKISKTPLKYSGTVHYVLDSTKRQSLAYKDLLNNGGLITGEISQEIINPPVYKLKKTMKSLSKLISYEVGKSIFISPKIPHAKMGFGVINALSGDVLVSESSGPANIFLDKIPDWRNKLVRSYINTDSHGVVTPIILNAQAFSSITHYLLYYANLNDTAIANTYLYSGSNGLKEVLADFTNLVTNNSNWSGSDNNLRVPNHVYELLRITAAKFSQVNNLKDILLNTGEYAIKNAFNGDAIHGVYEISKELLFVRAKLRADTVHEIYPEFEVDMRTLAKLKKSIHSKQRSGFISIGAETGFPTNTEVIIADSIETPKVIAYDPAFMVHVYKKMQMQKLKHYVENVLLKHIYPVPSSVNALFDSLACSMFDAGVFKSLPPVLKTIFSDSVLVTEKGYITLNDRLLQKPILRKAALELKKLTAEVIDLTNQEFEEFVKSLAIKKTSGRIPSINRLLNIKNHIDRRATIQQRPKLYFIHDLLMKIEYSNRYTDIDDYISSIRNASLKTPSYEEAWGGFHELTAISALFSLDITTYPSYSADTDVSDGNFFEQRKSLLTCSIPRKYMNSSQTVTPIELGFLGDNPKHYISIVSADNMEFQLEAILKTDADVEDDGNLLKLLGMGFSINLASEALRLNKNNMARAMEYIFGALQSHVDVLESRDQYNFEFQIGDLGVTIGKGITYIQQFHEGALNSYFKNYHYLEHTHNYIQWLFPNHRPSVFNTDNRVILKLSELELLRENDIARGNLFLSLQTMVDFFGGDLYMKRRDTGGDYPEINPNSNIRQRLENINSPAGHHNLLRITRILKYLNLMREYTLQYLIINYFLTEIFQTDHGISWDSKVVDSLEYWIDTITDPSEHAHYAETLLFHKNFPKQREQPGVQVGGNSKLLTELKQDYFKFPYKYKNKIYNIAYTSYGGSGKKNRTKILGILDKNSKIDYDRRVKKGSFYDNIMSKVHKRLSNNTIKLIGGSIEKIPYMIDSGNSVYVNRNRIGTFTDRRIIFN